MSYNKLMALAIAILSFSLSSCKKEAEPILGFGKINIEFEHKVGSNSLIFDTQTYKNDNGDDYTVSTFKYYVSNFKLIKADGSKSIVPESYLLVNAADPISRIQKLDQVAAGDYTGVEFTIGVDEARNFAGAQTGALDPAKGMFWSWNTGYIFLMFEGKSPKSTQVNNQLFYHVGGAKAPTNTIRTVSLNFPTVLRVRANTAPNMHLYVDIAALFKGKETINFSKISGFHGGANAVIIADNYANGLFKVDHIHN